MILIINRKSFRDDDDDDDVSVLANKSMTLGVHEGSVSATGNGATATSSSKQSVLERVGV